MNDLPEKLQEIVDNFELLEGQEKLEYLLELAEQLPPLPDRLLAQRDRMDQVHECMTPVFIHAEKGEDGRLTFYFDVPPESPTVRGYATIMVEGLNGTTPAELKAVPAEFYLQMGLQQVLSGQRLTGIGAILAHMKRLADGLERG
ncbi:MAG: SufE family protein [Anaerolineae bacterium]|nr:SufE family protein [Anaerolineae bacterium]RIK22013.1 MAG: cysteine desulfuration protein SufE [Anaerolineae bacterium]